MKCIQYGLYGQVAFKNAGMDLFFEIKRSRHGLRPYNEGDMPMAGPNLEHI